MRGVYAKVEPPWVSRDRMRLPRSSLRGCALRVITICPSIAFLISGAHGAIDEVGLRRKFFFRYLIWPIKRGACSFKVIIGR